MKKSAVKNHEEKKAQKKRSALKEEVYASEVHYRRLFESSKDGILILDAETGKIVDVNPFLMELLGYSKEEFIEKSIWEIGAFQDIIENKDKLLELQQSEYVRYEDLPLATSDGHEILVEFISNVYLVNNHKVIQCQIRDITARKETEAALEKTRKELEEIKKSADELNEFTKDMIDTVREPLLAIDQDLRVIKASRSFYQFFKVTPGETIGKLIYKLGNHQWDIPKLKELLEEIIPEKNSFDNYEVEHRFSSIGKRVMLLNARQIKRAFGKEKIILLAIEDITERKAKEDSLKETQRETSGSLNILLDLMQTPIIIWDTSMIIKRFNHKFELLSGYDSDEVIGRKLDFLFPKEKIAATLELLKNHLDAEHLEVAEIDILTKDNQIKTVLWNSSRILDEEGKNIIATISQDITNRKQSELALRKSESHLRTLVNTIPDLIWLKDTNGLYLSCNPMFERFFGASEPEIIGKTDYDFVDPKLADFFRENDRKAIEAGKPTSNEEWVTFADDGHRAFLDTIKSPIYDSDGTVLGILGIGRDITERKLAGQVLQASEKRFRAIFDQAPIAIALLDTQGHPIISNLRLTKMIGYSSDELAKMMFTEFTYPEDIDKDLNQFTDLVAGKISGYSIEKRYIHKNGTLIWANLYTTTLNDSNGLPQEIIGMVEDITERKKAENALIESEIKYRAFFENSMDAILLTSPDGKTLSANQAACNMFGYSEDELIKLGRSGIVDSSDSRLSVLLDQRKLKGKARGEATFLRKDGTCFPTEISSAIFKNQEGFELTSMIIRDVTERKKTEKEIINLAKFPSENPNPILRISQNGTLLYVNEAGMKQLPDWKLQTGQSAPTILQDVVFNTTISGEVQVTEFEHIEKIYSFYVTPIVEEGYANLYGWDITERKQAEKKLRESEFRFKQVSENAQELIWEVDKNGLYTYSNPVIKDLLGYEPEEIIGKKHFYDFFDYENREELIQAALGIFDRKESFKDFVNINLHKEGRKIILSTSGIPILDNLGNLIGYRGVDIDITERIHAEKKLLKLSSAVEQTVDTVVITDRDGIIEYVNPAFEVLTGYSFEEAIGKTSRIVKSGIENQSYYDEMWKTIISGNVFRAEIINKKKNGDLFFEQKTISPIFDQNKNIIHFVGTGADITERKRAEEVLRQSEAKFRNLINSLPDPVLVVDSQGRITYCNENAMKTFDYNIDEMLNRTMEDLIPKHFRELHKTLRNEYISEPKSRAMGQGKELFAQRKDGSEFPTEIMLEPVEINGNQFTLAIVRDITERKKIQNELKLQANLLSNVGQSVIATDLSGIVIYWNNAAEKMYGWSSAEAIGQNIISLTPTQSTREQAAELMKKLSEGESWTGEFLVKRKDGSSFPALVTDTPILDANGKLTGIIGISSDITERKLAVMELIEAKEKAEESDRLKTAFLNNVSHEIRTPLNAIVGFSGFLNDPDILPENRQEYTDIILQSSDQLLAIIDDIMSIASVEAGQEKIQENEVNINLICNLLKEQFSSKANEKNVTLNLKSGVSDDQAIIITDATKLTQILNNLVGNALKFTRQGYINYGYMIKDSQLEFYVEDTGIGIDLDMQEIIFDRFRQIETTSTRNFGGSGLGLSISKAYVEMLGGKMWLTSELGKGSVFYFTIPYKNANPKKLPDIPSVKRLDFEFKTTKTVLITEDEDSNFILLKEMLSHSGINIIRAKNGLEAVKLCQSNPNIDLVLMDIKMPEMDGYEATKRIKEFKPGLPIIAQTAYVTEADRIKALACGCSDYISKPISKQLLLSKINEQLHHL